MDCHINENHSDHLKRKIEGGNQCKCHICGFSFINETTLKLHTESTHNQVYQIKKNYSVTNSPPTKKAKETHVDDPQKPQQQNVELEHERRIREKNNEIAELKILVVQLKQQITNKGNEDKLLEVKEQDPNIKELPESVKFLVEEGSKEYVVKGDGPCFLRTTSAHILGDEKDGPKLARDLNTHKALYRKIYEEKISADFPLKVTIGVQGQFRIFENSTEYFDWLMESKEAAYM